MALTKANDFSPESSLASSIASLIITLLGNFFLFNSKTAQRKIAKSVLLILSRGNFEAYFPMELSISLNFFKIFWFLYRQDKEGYWKHGERFGRIGFE
jgi:hypothetical protein